MHATGEGFFGTDLRLCISCCKHSRHEAVRRWWDETRQGGNMTIGRDQTTARQVFWEIAFERQFAESWLWTSPGRPLISEIRASLVVLEQCVTVSNLFSNSCMSDHFHSDVGQLMRNLRGSVKLNFLYEARFSFNCIYRVFLTHGFESQCTHGHVRSERWHALDTGTIGVHGLRR